MSIKSKQAACDLISECLEVLMKVAQKQVTENLKLSCNLVIIRYRCVFLHSTSGLAPHTRQKHYITLGCINIFVYWNIKDDFCQLVGLNELNP